MLELTTEYIGAFHAERQQEAGHYPRDRIRQMAALRTDEYEAIREHEAKARRVPPAALDELVEAARASPTHAGTKSEYLPEQRAAKILALVSATSLEQRTAQGRLRAELRTRIVRQVLKDYPRPAVERIVALVARLAPAVPVGLTAASVVKDWQRYHDEIGIPPLGPKPHKKKRAKKR